jgi:hypothetical protein
MRSGNVGKAHGPLPQPLPSEIVPARQNRDVDGASYYARRSARDPAWRDAQIASAIERERIRREEDPDRVRALSRENSARYRRRLRRDPERLAAVRAKAAERERERRRRFSQEERAEASRAAVERQRRRRTTLRIGLTLEEIHARIGGDAETLRLVLRDEVRSGRVHKAAGRFSLNGKLPDDPEHGRL